MIYIWNNSFCFSKTVLGRRLPFFGFYQPKKPHVGVRGVLYVRPKRRNLFVTLTNKRKRVLLSTSAATFMHLRVKRLSVPVMEYVMRRVVVAAKFYKLDLLTLYISMTKRRYLLIPVVRALERNGFYVDQMHDLYMVPHNGCRLKKKRRV